MSKRDKDAEKFSKGSAVRHKQQVYEQESAPTTEPQNWAEWNESKKAYAPEHLPNAPICPVCPLGEGHNSDNRHVSSPDTAMIDKQKLIAETQKVSSPDTELSAALLKDYYCVYCNTEMTRADARFHNCQKLTRFMRDNDYMEESPDGVWVSYEQAAKMLTAAQERLEVIERQLTLQERHTHRHANEVERLQEAQRENEEYLMVIQEERNTAQTELQRMREARTETWVDMVMDLAVEFSKDADGDTYNKRIAPIMRKHNAAPRTQGGENKEKK